jgi:hypothetical protein
MSGDLDPRDVDARAQGDGISCANFLPFFKAHSHGETAATGK